MVVRRISHPVASVPRDEMTNDEFVRSLIKSKLVCRRDSGNFLASGFQAVENKWTNIYIQQLDLNPSNNLTMFLYGTESTDSLAFSQSIPQRPLDYMNSMNGYIVGKHDLLENTFSFYNIYDNSTEPVFSYKLTSECVTLFSFKLSNQDEQNILQI